MTDAGCSLTKCDTWSSSFIVPQRLSFDIRNPLFSYLGSLVSSQPYPTEHHEWLTLMYALQSCASHSLLHRASSILDCLLPSAYVFVLDGGTHHLSGFLLVLSLALFCRRLQSLRLFWLRTTQASRIASSAPPSLAFFPGDIKTTLSTFRGTTT